MILFQYWFNIDTISLMRKTLQSTLHPVGFGTPPEPWQRGGFGGSSGRPSPTAAIAPFLGSPARGAGERSETEGFFRGFLPVGKPHHRCRGPPPLAGEARRTGHPVGFGLRTNRPGRRKNGSSGRPSPTGRDARQGAGAQDGDGTHNLLASPSGEAGTSAHTGD